MRNSSHWAALLATAKRKSMISLRPPEPQRDQDRPAEGAGAVAVPGLDPGIGRAAPGHLRKMVVDRRGHPPLQRRLERGRRGVPVILAPLDPLRLHGLHHPERTR